MGTFKNKQLTEEQEEELIKKEYDRLRDKISKAERKGKHSIDIWTIFRSEFIYDALTQLESEGFEVYRNFFSTHFTIYWRLYR